MDSSVVFDLWTCFFSKKRQTKINKKTKEKAREAKEKAKEAKENEHRYRYRNGIKNKVTKLWIIKVFLYGQIDPHKNKIMWLKNMFHILSDGYQNRVKGDFISVLIEEEKIKNYMALILRSKPSRGSRVRLCERTM